MIKMVFKNEEAKEKACEFMKKATEGGYEEAVKEIESMSIHVGQLQQYRDDVEDMKSIIENSGMTIMDAYAELLNIRRGKLAELIKEHGLTEEEFIKTMENTTNYLNSDEFKLAFEWQCGKYSELGKEFMNRSVEISRDIKFIIE